VQIQEGLVAQDPRSTIWQGDLSRSDTRTGDALIAIGDLDGALARYQRGLEIRKRLLAINPAMAPYRRSLAWSWTKIATLHARRGDGARALAAHEQALALRDALVQEAPEQRGYRSELAASEAAVGQRIATSDPARSARLLGDAIARARALVAVDPAYNDYQETLAVSLYADASAARARHDSARRAAALTEALAQAKIGLAHAPHNVRWSELIGEIDTALAELAGDRGDRAGAATARRAACDALEPLARSGRLSAGRQPLLTQCQARR